jgi:hypothetical protein
MCATPADTTPALARLDPSVGASYGVQEESLLSDEEQRDDVRRSQYTASVCCVRS